MGPDGVPLSFEDVIKPPHLINQAVNRATTGKGAPVAN